MVESKVMENAPAILISQERRKNIESALDVLIASYRRELVAKRIRRPERGKRNWSLYAFDLEGKNHELFWHTLSFLSNSGEPIDCSVFDPRDFPEEAYGVNPDQLEVGSITISGDYEKLHEILWKKYVSTPEIRLPASKISNTVVILYLDNKGNLWREPKGNDYIYKLYEDGKALLLFRHIIEESRKTDNYIPTKEIAQIYSMRGQDVRTVFGKFNRVASAKLKLNRLKIIDSKQYSGYRLNPSVEVIEST